jgi:hypothetical protein
MQGTEWSRDRVDFLTKRKFPTLPGLTVLSQLEEGITLETQVDERCYVEIGLKICAEVKLNCYWIFFQFLVVSYDYADEFTGSMMDLDFIGRLIICWPVKKDCSLLIAHACYRGEMRSLYHVLYLPYHSVRPQNLTPSNGARVSILF